MVLLCWSFEKFTNNWNEWMTISLKFISIHSSVVFLWMDSYPCLPIRKNTNADSVQIQKFSNFCSDLCSSASRTTSFCWRSYLRGAINAQLMASINTATCVMCSWTLICIFEMRWLAFQCEVFTTRQAYQTKDLIHQ